MARPKTVSDLLRNCASDDKHRLMLCGIAEDSGEDGVFRISTDTHRLIAVKIGEPKKERYSKLIYPEDIAETKGAYPDWRRVLPKEFTRSVEFDADALALAVQCAMTAGKFNARRLKFSFNGDQCFVRGTCEGKGEAQFTLASYDQNNVENFCIAFNGSYIIDLLPVLGLDEGTRVRLEMTESSRPVIITYPNAPDLWTKTRSCIMPMALA